MQTSPFRFYAPAYQRNSFPANSFQKACITTPNEEGIETRFAGGHLDRQLRLALPRPTKRALKRVDGQRLLVESPTCITTPNEEGIETHRKALAKPVAHNLHYHAQRRGH